MVLKPFFLKLTTSELHSVMTSGFATMAGSMFAAFIEFGVCCHLNIFISGKECHFRHGNITTDLHNLIPH